MTTARTELDALLSRHVATQQQAERREFDRLSGGRPVVLMGAGGLGRRTLAGLRRHGVEPLAFVDNGPGRHGTTVEGVRVLSAAAAAREFGRTAAFVVTIWGAHNRHRFAQSRDQLRGLGCDVVFPFPPLFWKYADALLPFYLQDLPSHVLQQREEVRRAFDVWEDGASRAEYVSQVRFRLDADFDGLARPVDHPQYFPPDLFAWRDDEWIVDGGAYDGDTVRTLSQLYGSRFGHLLAVEPDPGNFARLQAVVEQLPPDVRARVDCRQVALGAEARTLYLDATGTAASAARTDAAAGAVAVQAETIDALVGQERPTFIKLDIEGFEVEALHGARGTIRRHDPILAVCVYHVQDHLWKIPLMLRSWRDDYAYFLRPHNEEGWDLVCYGIPRARLARSTR
ncbi:MAG TPA: FkbM family methyltransferase [Vicinamibacterales bacterium]|nr:FkbM family methyltransferase [Vicinamibacterales bacterium]